MYLYLMICVENRVMICRIKILIHLAEKRRSESKKKKIYIIAPSLELVLNEFA